MNTRIYPSLTNGVVSKLMTILVAMLIISSCAPRQVTFRTPNPTELETFLKQNDITPIQQQQFNDAIVLLYEKNSSFGYCTLSIREPDGEMVVNQVTSARSNQPILVIGQLSGEQPFIAVIIQDPDLLTKTSKIQVEVDSQSPLTATTNGERSVILVSPSLVTGWRSITLYDAEGKVLYTQEG